MLSLASPLRKSLTLAFLLLLTPVVAFSQWTSLHGPAGSFISWITTDGGTTYFGDYDGTGGVYKTTDNGAHFTTVVSGVSFSQLIANGLDLVGIPQQPAGTVWVSHDGGLSWTKPVVLAKQNINTLYNDASGLFAGTDGGVYISNDGGSTWQTRNAGLNFRIFSLCRSGKVLIAGSFANGLFVSADDGANWHQSSSGFLSFSRATESVVGLGNAGPITFAVSQNGIFGSTDQGANWSLYQKGLHDTNGVSITANGTDALLVTGTYGVDEIYKWTASTQSWTPITASLVTPQLAFSPTGIISRANETLTFSNDGGATWSYVTGSVVNPCGTIAMIGQLLYADRNGVIYVSTDQGASWPRLRWNHFNDAVHVISYVGSSAIGSIGNDILLSDGLYGIRRVTADGLTATSLLPTKHFFNSGGASGIFSIGTTIFAGAGDIYDANTSKTYAGCYVSADNGASWINRKNGMTDTLVTALSLSGTTIYAGTEFGRLFSSADQGLDWNYLGRISGYIGGIAVQGSKIVLTSTNGIYASFDNGATFVLRNEGLPPGSPHGITSDANFFYVSTDSGVWKRAITNVSGVKNLEYATPAIQVFPNPVTSSATISYTLKDAGMVEVKILDALGRIIWRSSERSQTSGAHNLEIPMQSWPTGCYEAILSSPSGSTMLKLLKQ